MTRIPFVANVALGLSALTVAGAIAACHKPDPQKDAPTPSSTPSSVPVPSAKPGGKTDPDPPAPNPQPNKEARRARGTVPFGQHPPKPEKLVAPHIPELPEELAKQEVTKPPKLPVGEYACGSSHSGESDFPLICLEEKKHEKDERVARVLVPYKEMREKLSPLPKIVDHREDKTEAEVRNQGKAGTCTAFGTSAGINHSVSRWIGTPSHVSTMELWGRYHQTDLGDALIASVGQTFAVEELWPYEPHVAWPWRDCGRGGHAEGPCGKPVDKAKLGELERKPAVIVEQVEWLPKEFELLRQKLAAGEDPIIAIRLPRHFKPVGKPGSRYVADYREESGGHAIALAGYVLNGKDNYYLLHNSWGTTWGDGGYAWIHEATLQRHMQNGFGVVDARPINGERAHREGKVCPAGHAPDSLTGACAPECKEGGPQHNGVCPDLSDCPSGYVNLWGECIGAAPSHSGKDEKSGISWKCGPGGCAYILPKPIGKCASEPCLLSCPAPSFRAAKDERGLTCVE